MRNTLESIGILIMIVALVAAIIAANVGCSKYPANPPTEPKSPDYIIEYDSTGTPFNVCHRGEPCWPNSLEEK